MVRGEFSQDNIPSNTDHNSDQPEWEEQETSSNHPGLTTGRGSIADTLPSANLTPQLILNMQRRYGNTAVRRLLENQQTNVQRQGGPRRVPHRLQQQNPLIHTAEGPILDPIGLGSFRWRVYFELPQSAAGDGYIIQKVTRYMEDLDSNQIIPYEPTYWELWQVRAGQTFTQMRREGASFDDSYQTYYLERNIQHGRNCTRGIARFYEGPLPPEFGTTYQPGKMIHTQPANWNDQGTQHDATATWDIRPGHPHYNRFFGVAGTQIFNLP